MLALFWILLAAGTPAAGAQDLPRGQVIEDVKCAADATQSYSLYLPSRYSPDRAWPILMGFHPAARGRAIVEKYRAAAEQYGYIVAASNNSRNGPWDVSERAVVAMARDVGARFAIDPVRMYATGHSGGARVAMQLALGKNGIAGVIVSSAGYPDSRPRSSVPFVVFGTAGREDFNYIEMKMLERPLKTPHRVVIFDGGHTLPPDDVAMAAIEWLEIQAMKSGARVKDEALIARLWDARQAAIAAAGESTAAVRLLQELVDDFTGLRDTAVVRAQLAALAKQPDIKRALTRERDDVAAEERLLDEFVALEAQLRDDAQRPVSLLRLRRLLTDLKAKATAARESPERDRVAPGPAHCDDGRRRAGTGRGVPQVDSAVRRATTMIQFRLVRPAPLLLAVAGAVMAWHSAIAQDPPPRAPGAPAAIAKPVFESGATTIPFFPLGDSPLALRGPARPGMFVSAVGRRAIAMGTEDGPLELWSWPIKWLHDFELSFRVPKYTEPHSPAASIATVGHRSVPKASRSSTRTSNSRCAQHIFVPLDKPAVVMLLEVDAIRPLDIIAQFTPDIHYAWPAGLGGQYLVWEQNARAFLFSEAKRAHQRVPRLAGGHAGVRRAGAHARRRSRRSSCSASAAAPSATPRRKLGEPPGRNINLHVAYIPIVLAGGQMPRDSALALYRRLIAPGAAEREWKRRVAHADSIRDDDVHAAIAGRAAEQRRGIREGEPRRVDGLQPRPGLRPGGGIRTVRRRERPARLRLVLRRRRVDQLVRDDRRRAGRARARRRAAVLREVPARRRQDHARDLAGRRTRRLVQLSVSVLSRRHDARSGSSRSASTGGRPATPRCCASSGPT